MAQGASKLKSKSPSTNSRHKTPQAKKGRRVIAPKDKQRIKEKQAQKQLSSKINHDIERQMVQAAKGGKLHLMRGEVEVLVFRRGCADV